MPGRAQQMSPTQAYDMTSTRFGVPLKILSNKKALDQAMQQHVWTMRQKAQETASGEKRAEITGKYSLERAKVMKGSEGGADTKIRESAQKQAMDVINNQTVGKNKVDLNTPEGVAKYNQLYQMFYNQLSGKSAPQEMAPEGEQAGSQAPMQAEKNSVKPAYNPYAAGKPLNEEVARQLLKRAGGDKAKARALAKQMGYQL